MKNLISNWNFFRVVRLLMGIYILIDGARNGQWFFAFIGLILVLLPLLNIGCCATGNCALPKDNLDSTEEDDLIYEEVQIKNKV